MDPFCPICGDIDFDTERSGIIELYGAEALLQAILWRSHSLYLTPGPGTIAEGYLILAPFHHFPSFSHLTDNVLIEADIIIQKIIDIAKNKGFPPYVIFEHGAASSLSKGAACIDHAHLHLAPSPNPDELRYALAEKFPEHPLNSLLDIKRLRSGPPYIYLAFSDKVFFYETWVINSQFLRRLLAKQWGVPEMWNWHEYPFEDNFWRTIEIFRGMI